MQALSKPQKILAVMYELREHEIIGWRRRVCLRGKPDFVFAKQKIAVFVDGCFWHGCSKHCRMPKGNRKYWQTKIAGNRARDRLVARTLRRAGWWVLRIWEHELARKNEARLVKRLKSLMVVFCLFSSPASNRSTRAATHSVSGQNRPTAPKCLPFRQSRPRKRAFVPAK